MFSDDDGLLRDFCQQLPLGVTREDYSAVKRRLDQLSAEGVGDLRSYLSENSDVLFDLVRSIRHLDANDSQLKLFRVDSVQEYVDFTHKSEQWKIGGWAEFYARNFANLLDGESRSVDYSDFAADGTPIKYRVIAWIPAGRESDWSIVISTHEDITEARVSSFSGTVQDITDRTKIEEALRETQMLYRKAERMGNIGFWEWDSVEEKMISCSEEFARIFEMSVDETLTYFSNPENNRQVVHPADLERYVQHVEVPGDQNSRTDIEYRIITKSGELRYVLEQAEVVLDDNGKHIRSFGTIQDITERVQAEEKLRQSHVLFSQAEKIGKLGHWEWDSVNERMISCSEQFAKIFEMTVEETLAYYTSQKKHENVIHPDDRERYEQHIIDTVNQLTGANIEYRVITAKGNTCHVHLQSQIVTDEQDNIVQSFGTVQDITERVQAEERLRHSHEHYSQAEKIGKLGHWEWDSVNERMISCSEEYARFFGMSVDEAITHFSDLESDIQTVHPADLERYEQHIIDTEEQRTGANIEFRIVTAKGKVRHVHLQSQIETDDQNRVIRSFGTLQDISDRVRLESERNRLAEQLLHGQKMESLGVLAGGIAHDFNNILSAVLGYATLAQEEAKGLDSLSVYLQQIVKSGERARDLTQQILTFSRQSEVTSHPMDVVSVIHEVISLLQATVPANTVFEHSLDSDCGTILANQTVLHQLLMNLCTNAVQAMEPNGGTVTIVADMAEQTELPAELESSAAPGWLRIRIADTGAGIPEDIRDMIFDPFFTTKEVGHGTGMGLAAVHGIVSKLGGVIQVSSDLGSGTQFEVFLPTTVDPVVAPAPDGQKFVKGSANILFIDDEESLVNLATIQLERLGYAVSAFSNPVEAIASAAADPGRYDVLITDFSMPRMTGLKAASKFTALNPGLPVLLVTGLDPDISDAELAAAGIRKTLIKPYSMADLSRAISESLE